jgi:hypothetical protein
MGVPARLKRLAGRHARVDGIPFELPVRSEKSPALMAAFPIDPVAAARLLQGNEVHPLVLGGKGFLIITVIDYRITNIGKYIEYSIAIACTHGRRKAPPILPLILQKTYGTGQYVVDLPVSTEISVKGGKGIWGMPKHRASLDFLIGDDVVSSQYDLDGQMVMRIDVDRTKPWLPMRAGGVNYCAFRGMLMKSYIYFRGKLGFSFMKKGSARITLGDHPRAAVLRALSIGENPLFSGFFPETSGTLDDHFEGWFLSFDSPPTTSPEGLESVADLGLGEEWPPAPDRTTAGREHAHAQLSS